MFIFTPINNFSQNPFSVSRPTFQQIEETARLTGLFLSALFVTATSVICFSQVNEHIGETSCFLVAPEILITRGILSAIAPLCGNLARTLAGRCMQIKDE